MLPRATENAVTGLMQPTDL